MRSSSASSSAGPESARSEDGARGEDADRPRHTGGPGTGAAEAGGARAGGGVRLGGSGPPPGGRSRESPVPEAAEAEREAAGAARPDGGAPTQALRGAARTGKP